MTDPRDGITRRQVLQAGSTFAGYALAADTVLAQAIKTDTDGILAGDVHVKIGDYAMPAYEARPATGKDHPIVLVISEVFGLHEYIRDAARRFAKEGFYAVAPELFAREGGVAHLTDLQAVLKVVLTQRREQTLGDCAAAIDWARTRPAVRADRVGATGWCWGGSTTIHVAATNPRLRAAVSWYGPPGRPYQTAAGPVTGFDLAKDVTIPFLGLYGERDTGPTPDDARKFIELVRRRNPNVEIVIYPGAGHGFHADYRPAYNAAAATDAWKRCVAFFGKHLRA